MKSDEFKHECPECGQPLPTKFNRGVDWFLDNILQPIIYFSLGVGSVGIIDILLMFI